MATEILSPELIQIEHDVMEAAKNGKTKTIVVDGVSKVIPYPFPSPEDWRDCWIYFLMMDRFNNPDVPPQFTWNQRCDGWQGGTFKGVKEQLGYIENLGAKAIWLSPVLKNAKWSNTYYGYAIQDFLNLDPRFASDHTVATAERELNELVEEAHARGIYIILDIVLNHSAQVFNYVLNGSLVNEFASQQIMDAPFGQEPPIEWIDRTGKPQSNLLNDIPSGFKLSPDDAVWPSDLQVKEFFRRRGDKLTDAPPPDGFVRGDFGTMRQLVVEYDAAQPAQPGLLNKYGRSPVLNILIRIYQNMIAKYDIDGFRLDTVKYVAPDAIQTFGNAMREFALSIGKKNFFTFAEVYDQESIIDEFIGRHSSAVDGFGLDAALDFPTFYNLPWAAKGLCEVEKVRAVFENRKKAETGLISSHGEAGKYFVSFLDNHDQPGRFNNIATPKEQVSLGLTALFCLQGVPCLYYGTEQGLQGTIDANGSLESVREALWGKGPSAFDQTNPLFVHIQAIARLRMSEPAIRYGRIYFREISGNGSDFGHSFGKGGMLAFSRILYNREIMIAANTSPTQNFQGQILLDLDLNRPPRKMSLVYSNLGTSGTATARIINQAKFYDSPGNLKGTSDTAALDVNLAPMEIQIFAPVL